MRFQTFCAHTRLLLAAGAVLALTTSVPHSAVPMPEDEDKAAAKSPVPEIKPSLEIATFAGGCFWCMEPPFEKLDGVESVVSGYTGGPEKNPSYKQVSSGTTGHAEAVQIRFRPGVISYRELVDVFWHNVDPTTADRQFCDRGSQYRSGIFYHDKEQQKVAEETRQAIVDSGRLPRVTTEITMFEAFYMAEEYHQDFYKKNPSHYKSYRKGCGRDDRLRQLWGEEAGH